MSMINIKIIDDLSEEAREFITKVASFHTGKMNLYLNTPGFMNDVNQLKESERNIVISILMNELSRSIKAHERFMREIGYIKDL